MDDSPNSSTCRASKTRPLLAPLGTPEIIDTSTPIEPAPAHAGPRFEVMTGRNGFRDGVYWIGCKAAPSGVQVDEYPVWLCSPLSVEAWTRNGGGSGWGRLLVWKDGKDQRHQWVMPCSLLASEGSEIRRELLDQGLIVSEKPTAHSALIRYLRDADMNVVARSVTVTGWHGNAFVLPQETYGDSKAEPIIFQTNATDALPLERGGTMQGWREHVAAPCAGNSRLVLALSCGFAGPCLGLTDSEGGGLHLRGGSSLGKTTAVLVAASIFGPPGFMRSWRQTDNALEGTASLHSDLLLPLDEIGQLDPSKAGAVAYMLANGQGKGRAARDGTSRAIAKFQLMFLSSGEVSLGDLITESGGTQRAGQDVRVIDIAADAGAGFGMFERLPTGVSAGEFADEIRAASRTHYGHALPAFLQGLTASTDATRTRLKADRDSLTDEMVGRSESQVRRVAQRLALIGAAGELATSYGLTGWPAGEAMQAAKTCFEQWREARGTEGNSEPDVLLSQVRKFMETHGDSRFEPLDRNRDPMKVINRAGFSRLPGDGAREYLVLPEAFKEIIKGHNAAWATGVLIKAGWLKPGAQGKTAQKVWIPDFGRQARVYVVDGDKVHSGD